MRAPAGLRFVLATRHDLRLGLHRLRLAGELTEIRAADLRFTLDEARALFEAAGIPLSDPGPRAAAMSGPRAGRRGCGWRRCRWPGIRTRTGSRPSSPGSERTVAEYLLAEVLDRQPRAGPAAAAAYLGAGTGERRTGRPADRGLGWGAALAATGAGQHVRGRAGCAAVLVPLPPAVRRPAAAGAAGQRAGRTARAARRRRAAGTRNTGTRSRRSATPRSPQDWGLAARVLSDHWVGLGLNGLGATAYELLAGFPAGVIAADAELAARRAGDEVARGSLDEAERYLALATRGLESVPADRRGRSQVVLAVVRMRLARQRGDVPAVAEQAQRLLEPAGAADPARAWAGRGPAGAGADQPRHRRTVDSSLRRGRPAPGAGHRPGAPDRAALPGGHRPVVVGAAGQLAVVPAGGPAQQAGDRAGRTARLDRGAGRRGRLPGAGFRADRPGPARGRRASARAGRAHPAGRDRTGGRDAAPLRSRDAGPDQRPYPKPR